MVAPTRRGLDLQRRPEAAAATGLYRSGISEDEDVWRAIPMGTDLRFRGARSLFRRPARDRRRAEPSSAASTG